MNRTAEFKQFAERFVRAYWATVKDGNFNMPPNEPETASLDEMLSDITYKIGVDAGGLLKGGTHNIHMKAKEWAWWKYSFRYDNREWQLVGASARSDDPSSPHDLMGPCYAEYFQPFLEHVTSKANI